MTGQEWFPDAGVVCALLGLVLGWFVPRLVARIPEPEQAATGRHEPDETGGTRHPSGATSPVDAAEEKETYVAIAALPALRLKTAAATGVVAGMLGARVGWAPELGFLLYLAPVGVALALVDWRTRLLPTWLIAPSYVAVGGLAALASALSGDWSASVGAGLGWLVAGGTFFALWFVYPRGMGYGDVRLSGVLGLALGWLGWAELLTGVYAGFLLGGVGGLLLSVLRLVDRKAYPFGPFMLVGAWLGVLFGPYVAAWYA
jgi:leader peptidase (prepilin peptidase)/N-methyltransferase